MSSVGSHILNHKRTGGHFIGLGVSGAVAMVASLYVAPTSASTGFLNSAGSTFNFGATGGATAAANAETAIAAAFDATTDDVALAAGVLLEDMGDRITFSAQGQTIAIFAKVRQLAQVSFEGAETPYYICIWAGAPGGSAGSLVEMKVGVARL